MIRFILFLRSISWTAIAAVGLVAAAIVFNSATLAISAIPLALLASKE
jgi:hypothetical protein